MGRFLLVAMVLVGCAKSSGSRGVVGAERGDCRAAEPKCESGLLCLSNVCVRPPPADCTNVAETFASFDLGNYAEPEERAPVVAKYKAACEKVYVSKEEGECIDKARDKWTAEQCAPKMFPPSGNKGDCKQVVARISNALQGQLQNANDPSMKQWFDTTLSVMQQSCEQDGWPEPLKKCILSTQDVTGVDAMQTCNGQMPPALQAKLQQRMQTAMQEQNR